MEFRRLTALDRASLLDLFTDCYATWDWGTPVDLHSEAEVTVTHLINRLDRMDETSAAWDGDRVVGLSGFSPARLLRGRGPRIDGRAQLNYLYCHPEYWGTGLSQTLHESCIDAIRRCEYQEVQLWAPMSNRRARRFYETNGWSCVGGHIRYQGSVDLVRYLRCASGSSQGIRMAT